MNRPREVDHIIFVDYYLDSKRQGTDTLKNTNTQLSLKNTSLNINLIELLPRHFKISTNSGSCLFNTYLLKDTSQTICKHLFENPNDLTYHLNITDDDNVLGKFEKLYCGQLVYFTENELPVCQSITSILLIKSCPNYMKSEENQSTKSSNGFNYFSTSDPFNNCYIQNGVILQNQSFYNFAQKIGQNFTIVNGNNRYNCNLFGICASAVIRDYISKDPSINQFDFNYDDEFGDFHLISDFFNFKKVLITIDNVNSLKEIAEKLKIDNIGEYLDSFSSKYEILAKKIEDQQTESESIDQLFELLYHLDEKTVGSVKTNIVQSSWSKTRSQVQDLAAFIIEVIHNDFLRHPIIIELLIQLNQEAGKDNKLDILIPFIVKNLMLSFGQNKANLSFIYLLHKKGFIPIEDINSKIIKVMKEMSKQKGFNFQGSYEFTQVNTNDVIVWFLPEIIELGYYHKIIQGGIDTPHFLFIKSFCPDKIDDYIKMRDKGEPDDVLTKSLRTDDLESFQSFILNNHIDLSTCHVPFNIFENFVLNGHTNCIDYASAYGSIKCFKYLLLNHCEVNKATFKYAVFGGNVEIIKIIEQNLNQKNELINDEDNNNIANLNNNNFNFNFNINQFNIPPQNQNTPIRNVQFRVSLIDAIIPAILKHRNDLFDWFYEQKLANKIDAEDFIYRLESESIINGNYHSFTEILNTGYNFVYQSALERAAENGYYKLTQLIADLMQNESLTNFQGLDSKCFVMFGNVSIFKIYLKLINFPNDMSYTKQSYFSFTTNVQDELESALSAAIESNSIDIVNYFFDELVKEGFSFTKMNAGKFINSSLSLKSSDMFVYLWDKFIKMNLFKPEEFLLNTGMLNNACSSGNVIGLKSLLDLISNNNLEDALVKNSSLTADFTEPFILAIQSQEIEICKYIINKKLYIDYQKLASLYEELSIMKCDIFELILNSAPQENRYQFLLSYLTPAIENHNYDLVVFLLKEKAPYADALFCAAKQDDLELVNIILKHDSQPSFVNMISINGTALAVAVKNRNLSIVQRLLSIPGIDPNIHSTDKTYPLIIAFECLDMDMINVFLDFYGDDLQCQSDQLDKLLETLFKILYSKDTSKTPFVQAILDRILEKNSKSLLHYVKKYDLLTKSCAGNSIEFVQKLLKLDGIDVNTFKEGNGNTPLIITVQNNNFEIFQLLANYPQTDINKRNFENDTALTIAVKNRLNKFIEVLINNEKFNADESRLNYAFFIATGDTAQVLSTSKVLDVNYTEMLIDLSEKKSTNIMTFQSFEEKNKDIFETVLNKAVKNVDREKIDLIVEHPSFDKSKSNLNKSIKLAIQTDQTNIFRTLIELSDKDINEFVYQNENALFLAVRFSCLNVLQEILQNPNFDSKKNKFLKAFCINFSIKHQSFRIMNEMLNYDKEHDHLIDLTKLLPNGYSFFTSIDNQNYSLSWNQSNNTLPNIGNIVNLFIENGADPAAPDSNGYYPLTRAISTGSVEFVHALLDAKGADKIDYTIKVPCMNRFFFNTNNNNNKIHCTFLHMAAESSNPHILKEFLDRKLGDINATDSKGNTVLVYACKANQADNVEALFKRDDLDYLHCNDKGMDALKLAIGPNATAASREEYLQQLLAKINNSRHNFIV